jgi:WD40 repeat protein
MMMYRLIIINLLLTAGFWSCAHRASHSSVHNAKQPRSVWTIEWSPDGQYIAIGGDDSTLYLYDGRDQQLLKTFSLNGMIKNVSWHPQSKVLAIATHLNTQLLDIETESFTTIAGVRGGRAVGWNFNGELLALADGRGEVQLMDKTGRHIRKITKHNNHSYLALDWHPSRNILVAASDEILIFDTSGKQLQMILHRKEPAGILTVKWHPSGTFFASGDYGHENEGIPTLLQFWDLNGKLLQTIRGSKAEYRTIGWNKNGTLLATASDSLRIRSQDGTLLHSARSNDQLWALDWSPKGTHIITSSYSNAIDVWDTTAKSLKRLSGN